MFIFLAILTVVSMAMAYSALTKLGNAINRADEAEAKVSEVEERVEQLLWLHNTTINRMNDARTAKEDAETLTRELNAENVRLVKLVMALEAAVAMDYVSNLN